MRKRVLTGAALMGVMVAVAACHPVRRPHDGGWTMGRHDMWSHHDDAPVTVADKLDCPDSEGDLTRTAQAGDGKSCEYKGEDGREITLRLVALNGQTPQAALGPVEADLRALVPPHLGGDMVKIDAGDDGDSKHDNAKIDLPGIHIDAHGDQAKVKVFGINIDADGDKADIKTPDIGGAKGATIHAGPGGAEIRVGDVGKNVADLVFILAGDRPGPSGYRAVGYVARGPVAGPLVVGEFKARGGAQRARHDKDLEALIDLNVKSAA
jgi:hypothetical protein